MNKIKIIIYILVILVILLITPVVINSIMQIQSHFVTAQNNDWIGFFSGYLGGIYGGLITLLGVLLTIDYYRKKDTEENNVHKEDKRLSMMPYLKVRNLDYEERSWPDNRIYALYYVDECKLANDKSEGKLSNPQILFEVENIGLGTAVDIILPKIHLFGETRDKPPLALAVKDTVKLAINCLNVDNSFKGNLTSLPSMFKDLMGNSYRQLIYIKVFSVDGKWVMEVDGTAPPELWKQ